MATRDFDLGPAELQVLKALWALDRATVRQVREHLQRQGRDLAYTTVQTFLSRLEKKGCVVSDREDQAFVYSAAVGRDEVSRARVRSLLDQLYDGAAGSLVLQLVEHERLSEAEIEQLQELIERLDRDRD